MVRFDGMNVTFHHRDPWDICAAIERVYPMARIDQDKPKHGYEKGIVFTQGDLAITRVWWDGNPGVHVQAHREFADQLAPVLRGIGEHELVRADSCLDVIEERFFDVLSGYLIEFATLQGLRLHYMGDWARGKNRTLYVGSRQSPYMLRLYEKGWKEGGDPNWVRLESEVKPKGRTSRKRAAGMTAEELLWSSKWGAAALEGFGWEAVKSKSVGAPYRPSDDERARLTLQKQYGQILKRWYDESADAEAFVLALLSEPSVTVRDPSATVSLG
jgi:hypothetical protein